MAKKQRRKPEQRRLPDAAARVRQAHQDELRRAIRYQRNVSALNRQLTRAIRNADRSTIMLHGLLGSHPAVRAMNEQPSLPETT